MHSARDDCTLKAAMAAFANKQPTLLLDHGRDCCVSAREWFLAMDKSSRRNSTGLETPVWLREQFEWGPSRWPLYWCEAMQRESLDCGVLAALARASFEGQVIVALPAQLVQLLAENDCKQWKTRWENENCSVDWICGSYVYHEVVAVVWGDNIRIWNPTKSSWVDPELRLAYASTVAVCVRTVRPESPRVFEWGDLCVPVNSWLSILDQSTPHPTLRSVWAEE